jgi:hypothetical protein
LREASIPARHGSRYVVENGIDEKYWERREAPGDLLSVCWRGEKWLWVDEDPVLPTMKNRIQVRSTRWGDARFLLNGHADGSRCGIVV